MKILPATVAAFLCLILNASAQDSASVVTIRTIAPAQPLVAGKPAAITIELSIASRYHINSDRPLEDYLIPTRLEFAPYPGLTFGKAAFPPALIKNFSFSESPMSVYEGIVRISTEVIADSSLMKKDIVVQGTVHYQACDDLICLRPASKPFSVKLSVAGAVQPPPALSEIPPAPVMDQKQEAKSPVVDSTDFGDRSILVMLALVFLGGLALNLTPCVYPMIPITISYFGGQAQGKKGSLIAHALLYVVGMAVTYSILGVIAAMTGGLFGAALQYPPVLIFIALVMVLLALSMFDVYEFRVPAFLNRLAGSSQKGFVGTLLMGLTVGIVAAPCIGPFVFGLLTYVGNKGNAILGFVLFFVLAIGMGIPLILLGVFSGSIKRLPRSGAWMVWVRRIFGFILLAMAVYFLEPLFPNPLTYRLTLALIMLLAGIYLAWIDMVQGTGRAFVFLRNMVGILFFALALYAAVTGIEIHLKHNQAGAAGPGAGLTIQWFAYSEAMLDQAAHEGKPVFIDFYADWCAPCKELDQKTFSTPEVINRSRDFIMLKVDLTSAEDPQAEELRGKYQVKGVPTLVFLRPDGQEFSDLRGTGFEPKETFVAKMNRAVQLSGSRPGGI
ncbi:MAG: protein-disulfide reductase DsbD [Acidobacteria bacterium]|nr:protein-disulfide reductase DsbD [Acidobacteriota bacterium]